MFDRIRIQRRYPHPPEKVWIALTDRVALADWLMPNDFSPVVGHKFEFRFDAMMGTIGNACEVLEVDEPRRLVYTWVPMYTNPKRPRGGESRVTWTLERDGEGTILTLEHTGLEKAYRSWLFRFMLRFGWGTMAKRWIPSVAGSIGADGKYVPGVLGSTKYRYQAKTVPERFTKLP